MAKYEKFVKGQFHEIVERTQNLMENNGMKLYEKIDNKLDGNEIAIMTYKKFHLRNLSRAVLNLTFVGSGDITYVAAIIYGGGQGVILDYDNGAEEDMLSFVKEIMEQMK